MSSANSDGAIMFLYMFRNFFPRVFFNQSKLNHFFNVEEEGRISIERCLISTRNQSLTDEKQGSGVGGAGQGAPGQLSQASGS